jgi:HSP20 family protein
MNIVRRQPTQSTTLAAPAFEWDPLRMMRDMMRWDPFGEMAPLRTEPGGFTFLPDIDVKETAQEYVFKADLPGIKEKDVEVALQGNRLTFTGKREEERKEEGETYFTTERSYGAFTRTFTLPAGVDGERVRADLKEGVLTVIVPKKPEVQAKKIAIGAAPKKEKADA